MLFLINKPTLRTGILSYRDLVRGLIGWLIGWLIRWLIRWLLSIIFRFCWNWNWCLLLVVLEDLPLFWGELDSVSAISIRFGIGCWLDSVKSFVLDDDLPHCSRDLQNKLTTLKILLRYYTVVISTQLQIAMLLEQTY